jgi:hypothetical protein
MALKVTAKYYHLQLEVYREGGRWLYTFRDPHTRQTVTECDQDRSQQAAEATAVSAAHAYLIKEYSGQNWPVLQTRWLSEKVWLRGRTPQAASMF